jgi:tetratricopeptide (TPR) repeat protein
MSNFIADALAEYDRTAKLKQEAIYTLWHEQRRVAFLVQFDRARVREACLKAIDDLPRHWWPRLTMAFVDSAGGGYDRAAQELVRWADSNPSYSTYLYLAYFYQEMEKPDSAAEAVEKAVKYPIVDLDDDLANTECRGYSAGVYAFRTGKYATVIKLCDALLPVKENGGYAKAALASLRQAAVTAQSGPAPAFQPDDNILRFDPYEHVSLNALRGL